MEPLPAPSGSGGVLECERQGCSGQAFWGSSPRSLPAGPRAGSGGAHSEGSLAPRSRWPAGHPPSWGGHKTPSWAAIPMAGAPQSVADSLFCTVASRGHSRPCKAQLTARLPLMETGQRTRGQAEGGAVPGRLRGRRDRARAAGDGGKRGCGFGLAGADVCLQSHSSKRSPSERPRTAGMWRSLCALFASGWKSRLIAAGSQPRRLGPATPRQPTGKGQGVVRP